MKFRKAPVSISSNGNLLIIKFHLLLGFQITKKNHKIEKGIERKNSFIIVIIEQFFVTFKIIRRTLKKLLL